MLTLLEDFALPWIGADRASQVDYPVPLWLQDQLTAEQQSRETAESRITQLEIQLKV